MNTPISFEMAKLLKEKGFDRPCYHYYYNNKLDSSSKDNWNALNGYSAPTITEVVMWLYDKYGIWVSVNTEPESGVFYFSVDKNKGDFFYDKGEDYPSPTEAYEAAILYTLKNLIS
jgi:hypothetical protein